jgi:hypothetical protein
MGHDRWYDFYVKRAGETTYGMSSAESTYALALADRSTRHLAKLPLRDRRRLQARREVLSEFDFALNNVQARGGGTMWTLTAASTWWRAKSCSGGSSGSRGARGPGNAARLRRDLSSVFRDLDAIAAEVRRERRD